jgi:hypothetical protein
LTRQYIDQDAIFLNSRDVFSTFTLASWSNMTLEPIRCPPKMQPGSPCNLRRSTA